MVAPTTAYKHTFLTSGNVQGEAPSFFGLDTPADIIAGDGNEYTPAELAIISVDDSTRVQNTLTVASTTTGRSSHLFQFDGLTGLNSFDILTRFSHRISGNLTVHNQRQYIHDFNLGAWEQMAALGGAGNPRTITGDANGPTFAKYQDGAGGPVYVLHWDYEGVFRTGGGCVHGDTLITLADGSQKKAIDLRFGDMIMVRIDGVQSAQKLKELTVHYWQPWIMVHVIINEQLSFVVNDEHMCPIGLGDDKKRARDLVEGDQIPDITGQLWTIPVGGIQKTEEYCYVVDIDFNFPHGITYMVNGGLLVRSMPYD